MTHTLLISAYRALYSSSTLPLKDDSMENEDDEGAQVGKAAAARNAYKKALPTAETRATPPRERERERDRVIRRLQAPRELH